MDVHIDDDWIKEVQEYWAPFMDDLGKKGERLGERLKAKEVDPEIHKCLMKLEPRKQGSDYRILDIGAGPISTIGWMVNPNYVIHVTPIDPLAIIFNKMLDDRDIDPPYKTEFGFGEALHLQFPENHFDLSFSQNALDHTTDPIRVLKNMMHVTRPGGHVVFRVYIDEGVSNKYNGMHKWNFDQRDDGYPYLWSPYLKRTLIHDIIPGPITVSEAKGEGLKPMMSVTVRKPE